MRLIIPFFFPLIITLITGEQNLVTLVLPLQHLHGESRISKSSRPLTALALSLVRIS